MGNKEDTLENLCINKKGKALFQGSAILEEGSKEIKMCSCTEFECKSCDEKEINRLADRFCIKKYFVKGKYRNVWDPICPYLNEEIFHMDDTYHLGCDYRNNDEKEE